MKLPVKSKPLELDTRKFIFTIFGAPKCGKTTFASHFPDAVFLATEAGTKFVEVNQITDDEGNAVVLKTWKEFRDAVKMLLTTPHDFKTVVIDTCDNAADMCTRFINTEQGWAHESSGEYGKGSALIKREFKMIMDALLASGMGVVFISHEKESEKEEKGVKRKFTDLSLGNSFKGYIAGASDFIFYGFRDQNGKRMLRTKATPNINAGDRSGRLPEIIPMDFSEMIKLLTTNKIEQE